MATYVYKGFSTKQYQHDKNFVMTDIELVKEDLVNHIFTRKGERIRMANFGTIIPDLVFEPLTDVIVGLVESELRAVFEYDPRVELVDMVVIPLVEEGAIIALVDLNYVELREADRLSLRIEFDT
jgi:Phage baseplate assembly protein W